MYEFQHMRRLMWNGNLTRSSRKT